MTVVTPIRSHEAQSLPTDLEISLTTLLSAYKKAERTLLALPAISFRPMWRYTWSTIKFSLFIYIDLLIMWLLNLIILLRNIFPGRWRYRWLTGPYLRTLVQWIKHGELALPFVSVRWLTRYLLHRHFQTRLDQLRRLIVLDDSVDDQEKTKLLSIVDNHVKLWPTQGFVALLFAYVIPGIGFGFQILDKMIIYEMPQWFQAATIMFMLYAFSIITTCFLTKRGLLLGANGADAYFPGLAPGQGAYGNETELFMRIGNVRPREFPLDYLFYIVGVFLNGVLYFVYGYYQTWPEDEATIQWYVIAGSQTIGLALASFCLWRRRRLGRG